LNCWQCWWKKRWFNCWRTRRKFCRRERSRAPSWGNWRQFCWWNKSWKIRRYDWRRITWTLARSSSWDLCGNITIARKFIITWVPTT
jgi:hypothetical protein